MSIERPNFPPNVVPEIHSSVLKLTFSEEYMLNGLSNNFNQFVNSIELVSPGSAAQDLQLLMQTHVHYLKSKLYEKHPELGIYSFSNIFGLNKAEDYHNGLSVPQYMLAMRGVEEGSHFPWDEGLVDTFNFHPDLTRLTTHMMEVRCGGGKGQFYPRIFYERDEKTSGLAIWLAYKKLAGNYSTGRFEVSRELGKTISKRDSSIGGRYVRLSNVKKALISTLGSYNNGQFGLEIHTEGHDRHWNLINNFDVEVNNV